MMNAATRRRVEQRAYALWDAEGRPHGRDAEHWHLAERAIAEEDATKRARRNGAGKPARAAAVKPRPALVKRSAPPAPVRSHSVARLTPRV